MKDLEKKFAELDDAALEQVTGGTSVVPNFTFEAPAETQKIVPGVGINPIDSADINNTPAPPKDKTLW